MSRFARRGAIASSLLAIPPGAAAPTYTDLGGTSLSGANTDSRTFSFTAGNTFIYMIDGFDDATGPGTLTVDGGAARNPTCMVYSAATGTTAQVFAAIWVVTGLSTGSHTVAWAGNAASLVTYGSVSGLVTAVVDLTNFSASGGTTLTASGTLAENSLVLIAATNRSLTATIPSTPDTGVTTIRTTSGLPAPSRHWTETIPSGPASISATLLSSTPQVIAGVALSVATATSVSDNFNRSDSAALGSPWVQSSSSGGVIGVYSNTARVRTNDGTNNNSCYLPFNKAAQDISADLSLPPTNNTATLIANGTAIGVGYNLISFGGTSYRLTRNGATINNYTGASTYTGTRTLRLTHDGCGVVNVYVAGTLLGTYYDSSPITAYKAGLHLNAGGGNIDANSNSWDNFSVA